MVSKRVANVLFEVVVAVLVVVVLVVVAEWFRGIEACREAQVLVSTSHNSAFQFQLGKKQIL